MKDEKYDISNLFFKNGAKIYHPIENYPLIFLNLSIENENFEIIKLLINNGIKKNIKGENVFFFLFGVTPLIYACKLTTFPNKARNKISKVFFSFLKTPIMKIIEILKYLF